MNLLQNAKLLEGLIQSIPLWQGFPQNIKGPVTSTFLLLIVPCKIWERITADFYKTLEKAPFQSLFKCGDSLNQII